MFLPYFFLVVDGSNLCLGGIIFYAAAAAAVAGAAAGHARGREAVGGGWGRLQQCSEALMLLKQLDTFNLS